MLLPKITTPEYSITLPLSKKTIRHRCFLVKEEKILLTAMENFQADKITDTQHLIEAVFQVLQSCIVAPHGFQINDLPGVDIEYLFLNIRKKSVGETIELLMQHNKEDCGHYNTVSVSLENSTVVFPEGHSNRVALGPTTGIILKYPSLMRTFSINLSEGSRTSSFYELIAESIDKIYAGDELAEASQFNHEELMAWMETLTKQHVESIFNFFETLPYLKTDIAYKCEKCGDEIKTEVKGTTNFFT